MKKIIFLLSVAFFIPSVSFAAIPITDAPVSKEVVIEKSVTPDEVVKNKKQTKKINRLYKKILKKVGPTDGASGSSVLNILSFVLAILGLALLFVGGGLFSIPLSIAAIILGALGLKKGNALRGLGIAGIAIGGGVLFLFLLVIVLLASLFR